jgi:prepilin-type N-terminal cleavage/methylation domain-containing protein/prepilin-type processing-associated H-X9-DG protein
VNLPESDNAGHRPPCAGPWAGGFTLVELLVVTVVIAILAGLLLPVLARAKATAQAARCFSNLRQLGLAAQMYWDEYGGESFRYLRGATNNGQLYWFGWLQTGAEGQRDFDPRCGALYPYLQGRGVELCPALRYGLGAFKFKAKGAAYGYGYNTNFSSGPSAPPVNVARVVRSSEAAVFADAAQINTFQPPASPKNPLLEEFYYVNAVEPTTHFRHARGAGVVFFDGHVGRERPASGSLDPRLPSQWVGHLRSEIIELR